MKDKLLGALGCFGVVIAWIAFIVFDIVAFYFMYLLLTGQLT